MGIIDYFNAMRRVMALARRRATGTPAELAGRLDIPERTLYRMIDVMKELEIPITYNKQYRSYELSETKDKLIA